MTAMSVPYAAYSREKRWEVVDRKWMLQEVDRRPGTSAALKSRAGAERARYLDDLWRFSCEAPDAPFV